MLAFASALRTISTSIPRMAAISSVAIFSTGAVRDRQLGKGRFDLLPAIAMLRIARHFEKGAVKYGDRNWEKGIPLSRYLDSALRHTFSFLEGKQDEDHLVAATWNLLAALETQARAGNGRLPADLVDIGPEIDHEEGYTQMIYLASPYTHADPAVRQQRSWRRARRRRR